MGYCDESAVSYTHLDVYKRQALCRCTVIGNIAGLQIQRLDLTGIGSAQPVGDLAVAPVSYTHLFRGGRLMGGQLLFELIPY